MPSWIEALAMWRAEGGSGKIPAKGSDDYNKIKSMMGHSERKPGAVKEGYTKIVRPTKGGVARKGTKAGAKFMKEMEEDYFDNPDVKVGPRGAVKKVAQRTKNKITITKVGKFINKLMDKLDKEAGVDTRLPKVRKVRADKGKKRGPSVAQRMAKGGKAYEAMMDVD